MTSPFPGMDPNLEEPNLWSDVQVTLIVAMRAAVNEMLPRGYCAAVDRYVRIHEPDADKRQRAAPNVLIVESKGNAFLKIVDAKAKRLVSVIELFSSAIKAAGPERQEYLTKRSDYVTSGVNLIEIDLLRAGQRIPMSPELPVDASYYVVVFRVENMPRGEAWLFNVRDKLPMIPIPLKPGEPGFVLNLRACLDRAYREGCYDRFIDYHKSAVPPLLPADAEWAKQLIPA